VNVRGSGGWSHGPRRRQGVMAEGGEKRGNDGWGRGGGEAASDTDDDDGDAMVEDSTIDDEGGEPSYQCRRQSTKAISKGEGDADDNL
jgi:hypothetical protein